jgi:hypothetical protein
MALMKQAARHSLTFLVILASSACSGTTSPGRTDSGSKDAAPADPFVGTWTCMSTSVTTFTTPTGVSPKTTPNTAMVVNADDGKGDITSMHTSEVDGGPPPCTFHVKLAADGMSAALAPTTCTSASGGTLDYTEDDWTLKSSTSYDTTFKYKFTGKTTTGAPLIGTGSGTGSCTKM